MPAEYEEGWVAHTAAWHQLADIKDFHPSTWEEAKEGYLNWEPEAQPVYALVPNGLNGTDLRKIDGWHQVVRSDNTALLTVQPDTLPVIGNNEFGDLIEYILGADLKGMPKLQFDSLSVLRGGRIVAASLKLPEPVYIGPDDSAVISHINAYTRHDGLGGMRIGGGMLRIVCGNTWLAADNAMTANGSGFTIKHTKNWADKIEQARRYMVATLGQFEAWEALANAMAARAASTADVDWFLDNWLPYSTQQTDRQKANTKAKREWFLQCYNSRTCEHIIGTVYGVAQAAIEACDHYFPARSLENRAVKTLITGNSDKAGALALLTKMV